MNASVDGNAFAGAVKKKPTLVMLPGLLCDRAAWAPQCDGLEAAYECIVPDSGLIDTLGGMAEHVLRTVQAPRFSLAGHSMGGRIALEIWRRAPERVERLALLDTGAHPLAQGEAGDKELAGRMALLKAARSEGMRAMGEVWARGMVHPDRHATQVFEDVLQMLERKNPEIFAAQIHALVNRPDSTLLLPSITCPTMLLCGSDDTWSPPSRHEEMARVIAGSKLVIIENSGHMSTMEQPEAVTRAMREWLAS